MDTMALSEYWIVFLLFAVFAGIFAIVTQQFKSLLSLTVVFLFIGIYLYSYWVEGANYKLVSTTVLELNSIGYGEHRGLLRGHSYYILSTLSDDGVLSRKEYRGDLKVDEAINKEAITIGHYENYFGQTKDAIIEVRVKKAP